ncbi:MAG TPA: type II secretion system F family protein [Bryobacteraceae bacterium]|nr:type II secretion system F family protein [Bryobacteraceae bacterium]
MRLSNFHEHLLLGVIFPGLIGSALAYALAVLVPLCALGALIHFLLSLPMRRRERARFFLDLLETALQRGDSPERVLVEMAGSRDRAPGVRFHVLAAHLERGESLDSALEKVPRFLPPQVTAILQAGQRLGDLRRVLPACRELLQDSQSTVRSAESYAMVLLLTFSPLAIGITWAIFAFVVPKLQLLLTDYEGEIPDWTVAVWNHLPWLLIPQLGIFLIILAVSFIHIAGPRTAQWFNFGRFALADWLAWRVPWKRQRLQRTFSRMLAACLDAGMPEAEAVILAADCTANRFVRVRASRVADALASGAKLPEAIARLDSHGEFRWRLRNAMHAGRSGFLQALKGWHDTLEARSFRGEQTASHLVTTALVILNGVLVGTLALATFGSLIAVLNAGALW